MKKKIFSCAIAVVMLFSLAIPALASSNSQIVVDPDTRIWQDGFGFHCNIPKGNGATAVEYTGGLKAINDSIAKIKKQPVGSLVVEKGDQKDIFGTKTFPITLERVGTSTIWDLITGDDIVCGTCGRTDWVTFSNNSGVINGKNIQVHHPILPPEPPPPPELPFVPLGAFSLEKTVEGENIIEWAERNGIDVSELKFVATNNATGVEYPGELDLFTGLVIFGDVPVGTYTVTEKILGIELQDIFVNENGIVEKYFYVGEDGVRSEKVSFISGKDFGVEAKHNGSGVNYVLPNVWDGVLGGQPNYEVLKAMGAKWVWDVEDTYEYGLTGSIYREDFTFTAAEAGSTTAYFAADNAAVVYVNGKLVGYSDVAFNTSKSIPPESLDDVQAFLEALTEAVFSGGWANGWNYSYAKDFDYIAGENTVTIIAANSAWVDCTPDSRLVYGQSGCSRADCNCNYNLRSNPCGLLFGFEIEGSTFDNKLVPTFEGSVSFNKVKYDGLLNVAAGEFEFDLFIIEDGVETLVGTFENDFNGVVTAGNLKPGSYVFREVISIIKTQELWGTGGHGYDHTWKAIYPGGADGLYFTVAANGDVSWRDTNVETPTVNNIINCKHALQWTTAAALGTTDWYMESQGHTAFNGGWLLKGNCGTYGYTVEEARCGRDLVINLWCDVSQTGMTIFAPGTALEHDLVRSVSQTVSCEGWGVDMITCDRPDCYYYDLDYHTAPIGHNYQVIEGYWRVKMCTNGCGGSIEDPDWCETCFSSPCGCP